MNIQNNYRKNETGELISPVFTMGLLMRSISGNGSFLLNHRIKILRQFTFLFITFLFAAGIRAQTVRTVGASGGADYSTLKAAFDDINAGALTGDIELDVISGTVESATATLNASGTGSAFYSTVLISPSAGSKVSITGNLSSGLIGLSGCTGVTIDGLLTGGDTLVLENTHASGFTVQFSSSASSNTLTRLYIYGKAASTATGVIHFSAASASLGYGNNDNVISNSFIGKGTGAGNPLNAIYSGGTSGKPNTGNSVTGSNISGFFGAAQSHYGIRLESNNYSWIIQNNNFYRESSLTVSSTSVQCAGISILSGGGYTISGNAIGYAASDNTGIFEYDVAASGHSFYGIYYYATETTASQITGNTITSVEVRAGSNAFSWYGIFIDGNASSIQAEISGNTIGSLTNADAIILTTTDRLDLYPLRINGSQNYQLTVSGNSIGSVNSDLINPGSLYASMLYIHGSGSSSVTASSNTIGASGNGIISIGTTTATGDYKIYGVSLLTAGSITLDGNTICHLYENSKGTSSPWIYGIYQSFSGGTSSTEKIIRNNTVHDIVSYSGYDPYSRVAAGIYLENGNNSYTLMVYGNSIYNIKYAGAESKNNHVSGIGIPSTSQKMKIYNNMIWGIENNSTYAWSSFTFNREGISGIEMNNSTNSTNLVEIYNNRILLEADNAGLPICVPIKGIEVHSLSVVYHNTVIISGSACGSGGTGIPTSCLTGGQYLEIDVFNNIFHNSRSGNGKHFAIANDGYTGYTPSNYTFFTDNNIYYTSDAATMAKWGGSDQTFAQWQASVYNAGSGPQVDQSSLNALPDLLSYTDMSQMYAGSAASPVRNTGTPLSGYTTDCVGNNRNLSQPYIGAFETRHEWVGMLSNDWATGVNWLSGFAPADGDDIFFSSMPNNDCVLDGHKIVNNLHNSQPIFKLVLNGYNLTVLGDLVCAGGAEIDGSAASSKLILNGSAAQDLPAGILTGGVLDNLTVQNPDGVTLNSDLQVSSVLEMNAGDIQLNGFILTLGSSAGSPGTLNYNQGHIIGSFTRWFASATNSGNSGLFPLGIDGNDRFVTVEYGTAPVSGGTLTATVNTGDMGTAGLPLNGIAAAGACSVFDVTSTSDNGYWVIDEGNGLSGGLYDITLVGQGIGGISSLCELTAIKRVSMGNWFESGTHEEVTGSVNRPVVKRTGALGWSNWGFGGGGLNPLPVRITRFSADCKDNGHSIVTWSLETTAGHNTIELQSSHDGINWITRTSVAITGDENAQSYKYIDAESGNAFYRLVIMDEAYMPVADKKIVSACRIENKNEITVSPNPTAGNISVYSSDEIGSYMIVNAIGQVVLQGYTEAGQLGLDMNMLPAGLYTLISASGKYTIYKQ